MRILNEFGSSTYLGTGAAVSVTLGFKPVCVIVWNETDGDELFIHINGMAAGSAIVSAAAVSAGSTNYVTLSNTGFSAGTSMSESGDTFRYLAF